MKKSTFLLFTLLFFVICAFSQVAPNKYYVEFKDKNNNIYSLENPEQFLSTRSLERRSRQGIPLEMSDLPVSKIYIDSLRSYGVEIINVTKWFNGVTFYTTDTSIVNIIQNLEFVDNISKYKPDTSNKKILPQKYNVLLNDYSSSKSENYYNYGPSWNQISIHNGQFLHNQGYRGSGMIIAVTDAGFTGLPSLPSFDSLYSQNRVIATRNFVHGGDYVYSYSTHGMRVLSILAGNYPENLIGSAPEAQYLLLMSEDPDSEFLIEELNWVSAAEFADSLGADIINVSLGYLTFDDSTQNHTYQDLNGETTPIAIAAKTAASKGMVVVASAANSGESLTHPWINTPGDAKDIITAGAVWSDLTYASFSSIGPSADGRVKPDVVAMGAGTYNQDLDGSISTGNGTSFSSPILSGLIACLWQKFPEKTNYEIIEAVKQSAHLYNNPNVYLGYGVPDFQLASQILATGKIEKTESTFSIYPNPFIDTFSIKLQNKPNDKIQISIMDLTGRKLYLWMERKCSSNNEEIVIPDLSNFKSGVYLIIVTINSQKYFGKIFKN